MNHSRRRRFLLLAAALWALVALAVPPSEGRSAPIETTLAAWVDVQYAGGTISAGTLDVPVIISCTPENEGVDGAMSALTLSWTSALEDPARMYATLTAALGTPYEIPTGQMDSSGPAGGAYTFTFTVTADALEAALGSLTNTDIAVSISTRAGTLWVSETDARRIVSIGTLSGGSGSATCELTQTLALTGLTAATPAISRVIPVGTAATSSLPAGLQDRRRTPQYTVTLTTRGTGTVVPNTSITIVLPDGLAFETGDHANQSEGAFTTSAAGIVTFRVVANRSEPATGIVRVEASRAFTILSAVPVTSVPLVAWGYSVDGQTGSDNRTVARNSAVPLWDNLGITGATAVGSSFASLFYADQNGDLWARGYNASGTLGDGTTTTRPTVVAGLTAPGVQLDDIDYIGTGTDQLSSVAVDTAGTVWATGINEGSGFGSSYTNTHYWQDVSAHYTMPAGALSAEVNPYGSVLMVLGNGQAMVAGQDAFGYSAQGVPVLAAIGASGLIMLTGPGTPITGVVSGGIGWNSSAVVTSDGKLYTAGTAVYGGSGTFYLTEKALPAGKTAAKVIVRQFRMLVLMTDGTVFALGANTSGSQGIGSSATPGATFTAVAMPTGAVVTDLSMGNDSTIFLLSTGAVYFAGLNDTGGLGAGTTGGVNYTPVQVPLAHTATMVSASWYDSYLALLG